uniref:Uncharacterized protein n=1 Tax=Rhizophora mucronata TaxID=61149 RepID=A0A2P2ME22_RHIMU
MTVGRINRKLGAVSVICTYIYIHAHLETSKTSSFYASLIQRKLPPLEPRLYPIL